jgi:hypothetical protein
MATPNLTAITTVTPGLLASQQLSSGEQTIYTVGAAKAAKLGSLVLTNTSSSACTVAVSVVASGGTAGTTNRVVAPYSLAAGDSMTVPEVAGMWLGAGAFLSVNAGTASSVDVTLSGLEFS